MSGRSYVPYALTPTVDNSRMSENVRRDGLVLQRRAPLLGSFRVLGHEQGHGVAAEPTSSAGREQRIARFTPALLQPDTENGDGLSGDRRATLLPSFARTTDVRALFEVDVPAAKPGELGDPQAGLDGGRQQGVVTATGPPGAVRRPEQGVDLLPVEERDVGLAESLRVGWRAHAE